MYFCDCVRRRTNRRDKVDVVFMVTVDLLGEKMNDRAADGGCGEFESDGSNNGATFNPVNEEVCGFVFVVVWVSAKTL